MEQQIEQQPSMLPGMTKLSQAHEIVRLKTALQASEARFHTLIDQNVDGLLVVDWTGVVRFANPAAQKMLGRGPQDMVGTTFDVLVVSGEAIETNWKRADGRIVVTEMRMVDIEWEGEPALLASLRDVTERKKIEQALRTSELKFRTLFNHTADAILIHDLQGHFLEVNEAAIQRLGYSHEELLGMTVVDIDTPAYAGRIPERFQELSGGADIFFETAHVSRDGTVIPIEISSRQIEYNGIPAILSVARDVSERERAARALRESEERLRTVTQNAPNIIMQLDRQGKIVFINHAAPTSQSELIGTDFCNWTPAVYHPAMRQALERVLTTGQMQEYSLQRPAADGMMRWYTDQLAPIGSPDEISGVILTAIDVTELKQHEARILYLNRILEAIQGVDQLIAREKDRDRLLQGVCDCLINNRGYHNAWIALFEPQSDTLQVAKHAGLNGGFYPLLQRLIRGQQPVCIRQAMTRLEVLTINDSLSVSDECPLVDHYGARRGMLVRLENSGRVYGVLGVSTSREVLLDSKEQSLFGQLAGDIALALRNIELEQERVHAAEERERLIAKLQKALAEVKTLSGLLPICSSCKRIRDQEGDWHEIDTYVRQHASVQFSHGLCPSCARRLYPDYFDDL